MVCKSGGPILHSQGWPALFAAYVVLGGSIILFELGYLLYQGRRKNSRLSLAGVVEYRDATSTSASSPTACST